MTRRRGARRTELRRVRPALAMAVLGAVLVAGSLTGCRPAEARDRPIVLDPSSIIEVRTNDVANDYPGDDILDIDRRTVIPDPNMPDWPDPLAQPTFATR